MIDVTLLDEVVSDQVALLAIACALTRGDLRQHLDKLARAPQPFFIQQVLKQYTDGNRNRSPFLGERRPMAKARTYAVHVTRTVRVGATFQVNATSEAQARMLAGVQAKDADVDWQEEAIIDEKIGMAR